MRKHFRVLSIVLVLAVLAAFAPMSGVFTSAHAASEVTRAEWVHELVVLFEMTVEEDNMPDDYFYDIENDSPYYRDVMLAAEFGVIDIEAGHSFEPENPVTRDFAAQTMNCCLGFIPDEDAIYPFSDTESIKYPDDALIAIERGWFTLIDGMFLPEESVTREEMDAIFADAAIVWSAAEIDLSYDDTYLFDSDVIEILEGTDVTIDENGNIRIVDCPETIAVNQVFIVYINKLPQAHTARLLCF